MKTVSHFFGKAQIHAEEVTLDSHPNFEAELRLEIVGPHIWISSIRNQEVGNGDGAACLRQFLSSCQLPVLLHPWSSGKMSQDELKSWYAHFGFFKFEEADCWAWFPCPNEL